MLYLVMLTVLLVSIFFYLLIELKTNSVHLLYIIPLTLMFTIGSYFYLDSLFGYPTKKTNESDFELLNYHIGIEEENIYLWVLIQDETIPKAIIVPYSTEKHEQLESAKQKMGEGKRMVGSFDTVIETEADVTGNPGDKQSGSGTEKSKGGEFSLMELNIKNTMPPKDEFQN